MRLAPGPKPTDQETARLVRYYCPGCGGVKVPTRKGSLRIASHAVTNPDGSKRECPGGIPDPGEDRAP